MTDFEDYKKIYGDLAYHVPHYSRYKNTKDQIVLIMQAPHDVQRGDFILIPPDGKVPRRDIPSEETAEAAERAPHVDASCPDRSQCPCHCRNCR